MDESYKEFYVIHCALAVFLNNESKQISSVTENCCQMVRLASSGLPNVTRYLSCILSIAVLQQVFSAGAIDAITAA